MLPIVSALQGLQPPAQRGLVPSRSSQRAMRIHPRHLGDALRFRCYDNTYPFHFISAYIHPLLPKRQYTSTNLSNPRARHHLPLPGGYVFRPVPFEITQVRTLLKGLKTTVCRQYNIKKIFVYTLYFYSQAVNPNGCYRMGQV